MGVISDVGVISVEYGSSVYCTIEISVNLQQRIFVPPSLVSICEEYDDPNTS